MEPITEPFERPREALNQIAEAREDEFLPDGVEKGEVEDICNEITDQLESRFEQFESDTLFSRRQAQVWVLDYFVPATDVPLTSEGAALYLSITSGRDEMLGAGTIRGYRKDAKDKRKRAFTTVQATSDPDLDAKFDQPTLMWVDQQTAHRLQDRVRDEHNSLNDVVEDFLDNTERTITLEEFCARYLEKSPAQIAVEKQMLETDSETLYFSVHVPADQREESPDIISDVHRIEFNDKLYDFAVEESSDGPQDMGRITLMAADNIVGMEGKVVEEGLEDLQTVIEEFTVSLERFVEICLNRYHAHRVVVRNQSGVLSADVVASENTPEAMKPSGHKMRPGVAHITEVTFGDTSVEATISEFPEETDIRGEDTDSVLLIDRDEDGELIIDVDDRLQDVEALLSTEV